MADNHEPILEHPGTHEMAVHTKDYTRFISMLKTTSIVVIILVALLFAFVF